MIEVEKADIETIKELSTMPYGKEYSSERIQALQRIGGRENYDRLIVFLCDHWLHCEGGEDA